MTERTPSRAAKRAGDLFQALRGQIGRHVSAEALHIFWLVAMNEGRSVAEVAELVGSPAWSTSRTLLDLGDAKRGGNAGYGLLQRTTDPTNLRVIRYSLTPKGKILKNTILSLMED